LLHTRTKNDQGSGPFTPLRTGQQKIGIGVAAECGVIAADVQRLRDGTIAW
jgi:hypothetical protein